MKYPKGKKSQNSDKLKKNKLTSKNKQTKRNNKPSDNTFDYGEESIHSSQIISNDNNMEKQRDHTQYMSAEDVRLSMARKLLQNTKNDIKAKNIKQDNFFMVQPQQDENQEALVAQQLKNQYLRNKNKLYNNLTTQYANLKIDPTNTVRYKGHTKCITAIQATNQSIFSCSKDKSIICWDRQTGKKNFITKGNSDIVVGDHVGPILSISYHPGLSLLASAAEDGFIKLWDVRIPKVIQTLKGHRGAVTGIKFGNNSNNLCSVSMDKTFKQWDCAQRGLIETFYGHNYQVLDIDSINENDFISSGNDHQTIVWKTQKQTQLIFQGHDYAIDRVRAINDEKFVTGCQDGSLYLWSQRKKKPIYKNQGAHDGWVCSLSSLRQTNIIASGDSNRKIKIWGINEQMKGMDLLHEIQCAGIVTDLEIREKQVIGVSSDQCRLGRWHTHRVRNQIQVHRFSE